MAMTNKKGHEPKLYETLLVFAGLLFELTSVKMRGPNKPLNHQKNSIQLKK